MAEYIERERARFEFERFFKGQEDIQNDVDSMLCVLPAADVAPVVHGRWTDRQYKIACSVCDGTVYLGTDDTGVRKAEKKNFKYCPNCGARMDGGADA